MLIRVTYGRICHIVGFCRPVSVVQPSVREFAGLNSGSGTFFHRLAVTYERISTEYWLTDNVKPAQEKSCYANLICLPLT